MTIDEPVRLAAPPETLDDDPCASEYASTPVIGITPSAPLSVALRLMIARGVRHLPVVEDGRCTTLVSELDVVRGLAAQHGPLGVASLRVGDVARAVPATTADAPLSSIARLMHDGGTDAVLIDDHGRIAGLITATDIIRAAALRDHSSAGAGRASSAPSARS